MSTEHADFSGVEHLAAVLACEVVSTFDHLVKLLKKYVYISGFFSSFCITFLVLYSYLIHNLQIFHSILYLYEIHRY
jgi:hypothetical protein